MKTLRRALNRTITVKHILVVLAAGLLFVVAIQVYADHQLLHALVHALVAQANGTETSLR